MRCLDQLNPILGEQIPKLIDANASANHEGWAFDHGVNREPHVFEFLFHRRMRLGSCSLTAADKSTLATRRAVEILAIRMDSMNSARSLADWSCKNRRRGSIFPSFLSLVLSRRI